MQTRNLTDEELLELGYKVLVEKLGPAGFLRFVRLHKPPTGNYAEIRDKIFEGMTVDQILEKSACLESERKKKRNATG